MPEADVQRDPCTFITATFIVQRALCTPREKGRRTVQKGRPRPKLGTNSLKFKNSENVSQSGPIPPRGRIWSMRTKVRPQYTYRVFLSRSGPTFAARGPRAEGGGGEVNLPQLAYGL